MSERTPSSLDKGTINSDRVSPTAGREQALEGHMQDMEDASQLRTGNEAEDGAAEGSSGAASPGRHLDPKDA